MKRANVFRTQGEVERLSCRGARVIVYDPATPIARLLPFQEDVDDLIIIENSAALMN